MKLPPSLLAALLAVLFVPIAAQAAAEYVEGEVIVTFKPAASRAKANAVLKAKSASFTQHFGPLSEKRRRQTGLVREKTRTTVQLIAALKDDPNVETVEPNYIRHVNAAPNDARFSEMWALNNTGQRVRGTGGTASDDIKFIAASALSRPQLGEVVVGVMDTGVDIVHPDLAANIWVNSLETANGSDDDGNGYADDLNGYDFASSDPDPSDSGYHGTHVAGTIAAVGNNGAGVIGVCDRVRILPLKVSPDGDSISASAEISALEYATALKNRGVNIVALNASFGGGGNSSAEQAAIQAAGDAGIILCVAAGNDAANNDTTPTYPASYRLANMIVVAASQQKDALASYSNYGATTVDLAAPGSNILSTQPATVTFLAGGVSYSYELFTYSGLTTGLTGSIIDCGSGNSAAEIPAAVNGNIALIQRGGENFSTKVGFAMAAGAKAAIIYNNTTGTIGGTLQTAGNWIPTYAISRADGLALQAALPKTGSIVVTGNYQYLDGTSMATPHVSGAVGFSALNFPGDTMAQRRDRVLAAVDVKPGLQGKVATNGRLNLLRLVDANSDGAADWQPAITTASLPAAIRGAAYSQTLAASGGAAPYAWSIASGALPPGLLLSAGGELTGAASSLGNYDFTVQATDSTSAVATHSFTLAVAAFGALDHFAWDYAPASAYAGAPFAVQFSARDSGGRLVSTAAGSVALTAASGSGAAAVSPANVTLNEGIFTGYLTVGSEDAAVSLTAQQTTGTAPLITTATGTSASLAVASGTSTAHDGIADAWKTAHGFSLEDSIASLDGDGDGITNLQEYLAGTDPNLSASALRISATRTDGTTEFTLSFPAVAGRLYRIASSTDLHNWTSLNPAVMATTTGLQTMSITLTGEPAEFFRVEIAP